MRALPFPLLFLAPLLAGCAAPSESGAECARPVGEDGPGFVRYAYLVRVSHNESEPARVTVPVPVDAATREVAPLVACARVREGRATFDVVETDRGPMLRVQPVEGPVVVHATFLFEAFSNRTLDENNWTLAPVEKEMRRATPPPSPNAFPIGTAFLDSGASGTRVRVYLAVDASPDDRVVAHRQDVVEAVTTGTWQTATLHREVQTLR